jgi:hypothetical protein
MARTKREEIDLLHQQGTICCYAKADKYWVRDADGMPWDRNGRRPARAAEHSSVAPQLAHRVARRPAVSAFQHAAVKIP